MGAEIRTGRLVRGPSDFVDRSADPGGHVAASDPPKWNQPARTRHHAGVQGNCFTGNALMKLLLWGAGGHAKVVLDIARAMDAFTDIRFLDDAAEKGAWFRECPILGGVEWLHSL